MARAVRTIGEHPRETRLAALLTEAMAEVADLTEG